MDTQLRKYNLTSWLVLVTIVLLLSACQPSNQPAKHAIKPDEAQEQLSTPTSAERGEELYRTNCALCHGDNGERGADPLKDKVKQLDDTALGDIILNGMPEKGMPILAKLTSEQVADLVEFLRSRISK